MLLDAAGAKGELQLVFEVAKPASKAFRFIVAVHDNFHLDPFLADFVDFGFGHIVSRFRGFLFHQGNFLPSAVQN